jgi:hypothetical protein
MIALSCVRLLLVLLSVKLHTASRVVQLAKSLPIAQGQDGIHRIIFPAASPPSFNSPSSPPGRIRKPRSSRRPQRVYTGTHMASLKNLPRESMCVLNTIDLLPFFACFQSMSNTEPSAL